MRNDGIKTSHELADILEDTARALRSLPPIHLTDACQPVMADYAKRPRRQTEDRKQTDEEFVRLAEGLPELKRVDAEAYLNSLTVSSIRKIATILDVRIPSKAVKSAHVNTLLNQVFDMPEGQELIRTFHKRNY